ncbi:MAG: hypothetical protein H7X94_11905 [Vallitaleaceae bacterium]|nr:hypothetical protein [Vallitaleaceae bacterium]
MYRLIIADDECIIRDGISSLIEWNLKLFFGKAYGLKIESNDVDGTMVRIILPKN